LFVKLEVKMPVLNKNTLGNMCCTAKIVILKTEWRLLFDVGKGAFKPIVQKGCSLGDVAGKKE